MSSNADLVRGFYDAIANGDVPGLLAGLDSNIEWTEAEGFPYAGTYSGHEAVLTGVIGRLVGECPANSSTVATR
jgi:ketosteroid isomerase-like protein